EGVATNMRRREAQGRCPELIVLEHDPARDAREFEPIVGALDELTPRIEVSEAGRCAFPTHGPARYFGGDDALARRTLALVGAALDGRGVAHVGVADGPFAALLAATDAMTVVPRGMSPTFLVPWPLSSLDRPELVDVWLNGTAAHRPTAGITLIRLVPDELATAAGRQLGFWGGGGGADERVVRALARVEGLLGPDAVRVPEWCGGRGPGEQVRLVPA